MLEETVAPLAEEQAPEEETPDLKGSLLAALLQAAVNAGKMPETSKYIDGVASHYEDLGADAPFWLVATLYWLPKGKADELTEDVAKKLVGAIHRCASCDIAHGRVREANTAVGGLKWLSQREKDELAEIVFKALENLLEKLHGVTEV
jgi:hypothetical protein